MPCSASRPAGAARNGPAGQDTEEAAFLSRHPEYERTRPLDLLRAREFARLDRAGQVYLDHAGAGIYADSQVRRHATLLRRSLLGNPHSGSPAARRSARLLECVRRRILGYFGAGEDEYEVIFTANATQALKLVGESYPFADGGRLLLTCDNHNSVNGLRELARGRGSRTCYVPLAGPGLRADEEALECFLEERPTGPDRLFAYPAQSNFSGVRHPLGWVTRARARGWDVLLDAAAYVPTHRLDLSRARPDYVALSFYKMFGYPTGVGALIARREALGRLRRPWFAGGTVDLASVAADRFARASGGRGFEDGTPDFAGIPALQAGFDVIESVGIDTIGDRVRLLTGWLIEELLALERGPGAPSVRLYGPAEIRGRGGTIALNFYDAAGRPLDLREVEREASRRRISLRTGCFCNPGAAEAALGISREDVERCFDGGGLPATREGLRRCLAPRPAGAVRVSLGAVSNFADVRRFRDFARDLVGARRSARHVA